jgi:hypothetical protein
MVVKACNEFLTVKSTVYTNHLLEDKVMDSFVLKINAGIGDGVEITQF